MSTKHTPRHHEIKKPVKKLVVSRKEDPDQPEPEPEEEEQPAPAEPAESIARPPIADPIPIPPLFSGRPEDFPQWVRDDMAFKEAYGHWMERNRKAS